nr:MAG TPA: hypothetical protein [Caudoviricetes sp.]
MLFLCRSLHDFRIISLKIGMILMEYSLNTLLLTLFYGII